MNLSISRVLGAVLFGSTIGSALVAGVFLAFSSFIMDALARIPAAQGIGAMQAVNVTVIGSSFLITLLVTALACVGLTIGATTTWDRPGSTAIVIGAALYLVGVVGVTSVFNVPRNDALAALEPTSAAAADLWKTYLSQWTAYNHVRTLSALAAAISFLVALARRGSLG